MLVMNIQKPTVGKILEDFCVLEYCAGAPSRVGPESFDRGGAEVKGIVIAEVNVQVVREAIRKSPGSVQLVSFIRWKWNSLDPRFSEPTDSDDSWSRFGRLLLEIAEKKYAALPREI